MESIAATVTTMPVSIANASRPLKNHLTSQTSAKAAGKGLEAGKKLLGHVLCFSWHS